MSSLSLVIKAGHVVNLPPTATVQEGVQTMHENHIGSIVVMDGETLAGIFTERDLLNRVVARGRDVGATKLSEVMSVQVMTVDIKDSVENCFEKMQETRCRHMPVVENDKVVSIVTMRNILEWLIREMEDENVLLKNYIKG